MSRAQAILPSYKNDLSFALDLSTYMLLKIDKGDQKDTALVIGKCIKVCHLRIIHGPIHP